MFLLNGDILEENDIWAISCDLEAKANAPTPKRVKKKFFFFFFFG